MKRVMVEQGTVAESHLAHEPTWQSPLRALSSPPPDRAKWLTRKEPNARDDQGEERGGDQNVTWPQGFAGPERFDLACCRTLLRSDGNVQASSVTRLGKRVRATEALAQAIAGVDDQAY